MQTPPLSKRLWAEFLGTFWLVLGGAGTAVLGAVMVSASGFPVGVGHLGVSLAFGLTVLTGAYALGHISGGHFNPAVTLGLAVARRVEWAAVGPYIAAQVLGGSVAAGVLYLIASGQPGFSAVDSGFATNGWGERSPGGYGFLAAVVTELVLTAVFLWVILGSTSRKAPAGAGPVAIGLALTLIHLISIPVTNTSVNPARSLAVAWFAGPDALSQVWMFVVVPVVGAMIAGASYAWLTGDKSPEPTEETARVADEDDLQTV